MPIGKLVSAVRRMEDLWIGVLLNGKVSDLILLRNANWRTVFATQTLDGKLVSAVRRMEDLWIGVRRSADDEWVDCQFSFGGVIC